MMEYKNILIFFSALFFIGSLKAATLQNLSDRQMSEITGQALLSLGYIDPNDSANLQMNNDPTSNIGFYKLGLEADLEINTNIKKLQLGCGGVNGSGNCDIDIDNLSLSGLLDGNIERASTSAQFKNPFIEFAIRNPKSASTRQIMGFRLSSEKVLGLLTFGNENSVTPNGINSFSGYIKTNPTTGTAQTASRNMTYGNTGQSLNGKVSVKICGLFICAPAGKYSFSSRDYNLHLSESTAPLEIDGTTISGTRLNSVRLNGIANIEKINFNGNLAAAINITAGLLTLKKEVKGNITGLKADITVDENLGFIHKLNVNNPFSLSLQNQKIWWPNADVAANQGWWWAFNDTLDIGDVTPSEKIDITNDVLKQVTGPISSYLTNHPPSCSLLNCIGGNSLPIGNVSLPNTRLDFPLQDLQLENQSFAPNCYGNLRFC